MNEADLTPIAAALEHLTGPGRGQYLWVTAADSDIWFAPGMALRVASPGHPVTGGQCLAHIRRGTDSFHIEATGTCPIWVNRQPVERAELHHGDMIEFGEDGPLSRLRIYSDAHHPDLTISNILGDMRSYVRSSRRPLPVRLARGLGDAARRILFETTILFRLSVLLALGTITILLYWQWRTDQALIADVATGNRQVSTLASDVDRTRRESLRPSDLDALRTDLDTSLAANRARLETLEAQSEATTAVIAAAHGSVAFLQAAYGLRHAATGKMLRHRLGPDGTPLISPNGKPEFTLDGDGPVAVAQITGTGFLVRDTGLMVTNRHVALPWEDEADPDEPQQMIPVMVRFQAWFPDRPDPVPVETLVVADSVDLAVLRLDSVPQDVAGLVIAAAPPKPGEAIIVMGYPTGLRSLLAGSGEAFVKALQADGETGFWEVAARLARAGLIAPLSTRGIIGRANAATMVYDAETTHGGSGGPVLSMAGEVVAVNTAIIPEFGGSNLGVPAAHIRDLLASAAQTQ